MAGRQSICEPPEALANSAHTRRKRRHRWRTFPQPALTFLQRVTVQPDQLSAGGRAQGRAPPVRSDRSADRPNRCGGDGRRGCGAALQPPRSPQRSPRASRRVCGTSAHGSHAEPCGRAATAAAAAELPRPYGSGHPAEAAAEHSVSRGLYRGTLKSVHADARASGAAAVFFELRGNRSSYTRDHARDVCCV